MEKLVNCDIIVNIQLVEQISGGNRWFDVTFLTEDKVRYKIAFKHVWDMRYSIENGYLDRVSKFIRCVEHDSDIYIVENSDYIKYFEKQVSGTYPVDEIKDYLLVDKVDTVIEVLTPDSPVLVKLEETAEIQ